MCIQSLSNSATVATDSEKPSSPNHKEFVSTPELNSENIETEFMSSFSPSQNNDVLQQSPQSTEKTNDEEQKPPMENMPRRNLFAAGGSHITDPERSQNETKKRKHESSCESKTDKDKTDKIEKTDNDKLDKPLQNIQNKDKKNNEKLQQTPCNEKQNNENCSDDEDGADSKGNIENFKPWVDNSTGKKIKKFHLCGGVSILKSEWKIAEKKGSDSQYVRFLAESIWGQKELMNRALDLSKVTSRLPGRSPVKTCTPKKLRALEQAYLYYLKRTGKDSCEGLSEKEKRQFLQKWRIHLKSKINSLRGGKCRDDSENINDSVENSSKDDI